MSAGAAVALIAASGAGAVTVAGTRAAPTVTAVPVEVDPDLPVVTAGPGGAAFRTDPTPDSPVVFVLAAGRSANVACWILGDSVAGPYGTSARWFVAPDGGSLVPAARVRVDDSSYPGSCRDDGWYADDGFTDGHWHHNHVWHYRGNAHRDGTHHDGGRPGPITGPPHRVPPPHTGTDPGSHTGTDPGSRTDPGRHPRTDPAPRPHTGTEPMPRTDPGPRTDPAPHGNFDPAPRPHTGTNPMPRTDPGPRTDPAPHAHPGPVHPVG
jgi:hypothetical protein